MRSIAKLIMPALSVAFFSSSASAGDDDQTSFKDVCHFITFHESDQSYPTQLPETYEQSNEFLQNYFVRYGFFDLDGDGIPERVSRGQTGTMGGDAYHYVLSSDSSRGSHEWDRHYPVVPQLPPKVADRYENNGAYEFGEAWLPYKGRFYDVRFSDEGGAFVQDAAYLVPGGARIFACIFDNRVDETGWSPNGQASNFAHDERRICPNAVKKVSLLSRAERIPASETLPEKANFKPIPIPGGFIRPDCAENPTTACKDIWHVDFDNDGVAERLLKVSGNSGAGRGCGLQFFVLLSSNNLIAKGDKEKLLLKLQQVNFADAYPASCTTALDWIKRSGRTVLEFHPYQSPVPDTPWSADTPSDTEELVHALSMARRKQSALLCSATFKITPQIVFDAAPQK